MPWLIVSPSPYMILNIYIQDIKWELKQFRSANEASLARNTEWFAGHSPTSASQCRKMLLCKFFLFYLECCTFLICSLENGDCWDLLLLSNSYTFCCFAPLFIKCGFVIQKFRKRQSNWQMVERLSDTKEPAIWIMHLCCWLDLEEGRLFFSELICKLSDKQSRILYYFL